MSNTSATALIRNTSILAAFGLLLVAGANGRGADLSGAAVIVSASAWDNVGVVGVQFYLDGQTLGSEVRSHPYVVTWDTTAFPDGAYVLTAVARDAAGNTGRSAPVTVSVNNSGGSPQHLSDDTGPPNDTGPPTVVTTGPVNGSAVARTITITAQASDDVAVAGVQFYVDGQPIGQEDPSAPYAVSWNSESVADGPHVVSATARDAAGNQALSAGVGIIVQNASATENEPGEAPPPSDFGGALDLEIVASSPGFRKIRGQAEGAAHVFLYVDGQPVFDTEGASFEFDWDVRPLIGSHEVRVLATAGAETIATTSIFYSVSSTRAPSVTLDVVELPLIRGTLIKASADVAGALRLELYVDGEVRVSKSGAALEHAWNPDGEAHDILFAVYDSLGVVTSASTRWAP